VVVPTLALLAAFCGLALYGGVVGQSSIEVEATRDLQAASPPLMQWVARFMTDIGHSPVYPLTAVFGAMILMLWMRRPSLAVLLLAATMLRTVSPVLKYMVDRPRPSPALVDVANRLYDPSFPSGHVLGATLLYGAMIYAVERTVATLAIRRALQGALVSLIVLMGYARVQMGEHWPTDVLAGWAAGTLLLIALVTVHGWWERTAARTATP